MSAQNNRMEMTMTPAAGSNNNNNNSNTNGTHANTKLDQQHSKPILSPTRSLDEGFESDPDRISTDSEHQTNATQAATTQQQTASSSPNNMGGGGKSQQTHAGSALAQLSSAATGGHAYHQNKSTAEIGAINSQRMRNMAGPQIIRRSAQNDALNMDKYYKERRGSHEMSSAQQQPTQTNHQVKQANIPRSSGLQAATASSNGSPSMQRLQYQKQRQSLVASAAAQQGVHRYMPSTSSASNGVVSAHSNGGGFRRGRSRTAHMMLPRHGMRSHSVDAISRHRQGGYEGSNALILKHDGSGFTSANTSRMLNYKTAAVASNPGAATAQALLVQPISSVTLHSSSAGGGAVAAATLPAATTLLNSSNVGDAAAALMAAAGGSPVIASATHSLYTFYPAEGNLQVWQTESGDFNYKSSRQQLAHKAPVCWTQSIPRQTRR